MIDHLLRDLQSLRKAEFLIGRIWVGVLLRRSGLFAFAALIAAFGLGMANVAGFYALQAVIGAVWAAVVVALADFIIAAVMALIAGGTRPGPEMDLALDVRTMAIESVQADARDVKLALDALGHEVRSIKAHMSELLHNPLDVAAQKLLVPAALSLLRGLRAKKTA